MPAAKSRSKPSRPAKPTKQSKRPVIMKISARNVLPGKVIEVKKGTTTAHVRIEITKGLIVTSSITNEAVDELDLKVGKSVSAIIKSSDVLVATA